MKSGSLFITGRLKEAIIIRGKNYSPYFVELYAKQIAMSDMLSSNAAFSITIKSQELLILVQEIVEEISIQKQREIQKQIKEKIRQSLKLDVYEIIMIKDGNIPKTASGKIKRIDCKKQYLKDMKKTTSKKHDALY